MMPDEWHLKKEVNITHLIATFGFIISAFVYSSTLDKRIQMNEQDISFIKSQRLEDVKRSEKQFDTIDRKLDELLTRVVAD